MNTATAAPTDPPPSTPWGDWEEAEELAPGIWMVHTPSHGGVWLSPERLAEIPEIVKKAKFAPGPWFEEDMDILAPILFFPEAWPDNTVTRSMKALPRFGFDPDKTPAFLVALWVAFAPEGMDLPK